MGTIQKLLSLTAVLASLALPTGAAAESLEPTPAELQAAHAIAVAYWHTELDPPVSMVATLAGGTQEPNVANGRAAQANYETGGIEFATANFDWRDFPGFVCGVYVHEYGHLVLGPIYFAATNPTDPAHSPDPLNIMYGGGETGDGPQATVAQQEAEYTSVGCPPVESPQPAASSARKHKHHHRHFHHRARAGSSRLLFR